MRSIARQAVASNLRATSQRVPTRTLSLARSFPIARIPALPASCSQPTRPRQSSPLSFATTRQLNMTKTHAAAAGQQATATKTVLVPIANGTEEMEAVIIIDVLRRAGAEVVVASVEDHLQVTCARGCKLVADLSIIEAAARHYDLIALPGGMPGAERLRDCPTLDKLLQAQKASHRLLAAICASPAVVLEAKGLIETGQRATVHPAFETKLSNQSAIKQRVVEDGTLTTSRGPGTAFEFSLALVKQLYGQDAMRAVAGPMVMYDY